MCQLEFIDEIGEENSWVNSKWQHLAMSSVAYLVRMKGKVGRLPLRDTRCSESVDKTSQLAHYLVQPGDMVRIRSIDEIQKTLDRSGRTRGCLFTPGMYNFCGKEYRVSRTVNHFFDETKRRMCRCNNLFLLEGVHCSPSTCDRRCFYFWHVSWLQKI